jgi:hypothetical protein
LPRTNGDDNENDNDERVNHHRWWWGTYTLATTIRANQQTPRPLAQGQVQILQYDIVRMVGIIDAATVGTAVGKVQSVHFNGRVAKGRDLGDWFTAGRWHLGREGAVDQC